MNKGKLIIFEGYEYLAEKYQDTWVAIDAKDTIENIHQQVVKVIEERFVN